MGAGAYTAPVLTARAYLDHAATTPMVPEAIEAMARVMATVGNASSLHTSGRGARRLVEESRESIAEVLDARPSEVVFTSGGTEADNLAVVGTYRARRRADPRRRRLIVGTTEHHAVLDAVDHLVTNEGAVVSWAECGPDAVVPAEAVAQAIGPDASDVALVSVMWANNEVGSVSPVRAIATVAAERGVPFHTDAVQAVGQLDVSFATSGAHLLALSAHKVGGPVGVGALLVARDHALQPLTYGGGQERQIRSGTLPVAAIVGLATALRHTASTQQAGVARLATLRDRLATEALRLVPGARLSGPWAVGDTASRLAGNVHLTLPGCEGDSLLYLLDAAGVECSTGSACQAGVPRPSHVLLAMGMTPRDARGALRVTLGHTSTDADVDRFLAALPGAVQRAQRAEAATSRVP